jgi:signal transduction histidine kinase
MLTKGNPARLGSRLRRTELLLLMLGLAVACSVAFSASSFAQPIFFPALLYLPLPLVIWAAIRFRTLGASASIFVVTVASISTALHGPTIFEDGNVEANVRALQLFLVPLCVSALLLGAAIDELRHAERIAARVVQSVIAAQDDERRTLAKHLIDDVCQRLAASTWETVQERKAVALEREVQRSIQDLRELSYVLHPPMLEDGGLELALRSHLKRHFEHTGVAVTLDISGFERLPAEVELTIFRVIEEALANIKKFDRATARISIQDTSTSSGRGPVIAAIEHVDRSSAWFPRLEALIHRLSPNKSDPEIGQVRMRERLRRVGGSLEIFRGARNTLIRATIPIISGALPLQAAPQRA